MSLEKLTEKLLYNSIVEVWIALCNDNNGVYEYLSMIVPPKSKIQHLIIIIN